MKKLMITACCLFFTHCSSFFINISTIKLPVIDSFNINPHCQKGDFSIYTSNEIILYLEVLDKTESSTIIKFKTTNLSSSQETRNSLFGIDNIYYEYHLDKQNKTFDAYLVQSDTKKYKLNQQNRAYITLGYNTKEEISESKYTVITKAGSFSCALHVFIDKEECFVSFINTTPLLGYVKRYILTKDEYDNFAKLTDEDKIQFKSKNYFELTSYGRTESINSTKRP